MREKSFDAVRSHSLLCLTRRYEPLHSPYALTPYFSSYSSSGPCLPFAVLFFSFPFPLPSCPLTHPTFLRRLSSGAGVEKPTFPARVAPRCFHSLAFVTCRRVRIREFHEMLKPERRNPPSDTDNSSSVCILFVALAHCFPRTVV